jgi:hypothetical protein
VAIIVQRDKDKENAEFEEMWTTLEGARIDRERNKRPQPEDKCKPIFKKDRAGYQQFYVSAPRGYSWLCWCLSEHVNAAGYFLLWRRGRKMVNGASTIVESDIQAAKDRSVLMRRAEKYQQEGWARADKRKQAELFRAEREERKLLKRTKNLPTKHKS